MSVLFSGYVKVCTPPDLATITNILAQHQSHPMPSHISVAKYAIQYLKDTKTLGIMFQSHNQSSIESFVQFPLSHNNITSFTDANWGPQDQSAPKPSSTPVQLETFKTRSISGFLIYHHGPLHWSSKHQTVTARSSAESEIYATDKCVKYLQYIHNILTVQTLIYMT